MKFKQLHSLTGHNNSINCIRFTRDGNYCMTAGDDKKVLLFNPHKSSLQQHTDEALLIKSYSGIVFEIAFIKIGLM